MAKKKTAKKAKPAKKAAAKKKPAIKAKAKAKPKAAPKKKPAAKKPAKETAAKTLSFTNLAKWEKYPFDQGGEEFDYLAATNDSVAWEDNFGQEPEHLMVHEGNVSVAGPVALNGWKAAQDSQQTAYIIDGDLEVDGSIVFDQSDIMTTLWVTGNLKAKRIACMSTATLIVGGSLEIGDILVTDLEDAGHLIVHGALSVPTWIDLSQGRGCIELGQQPQTQFLSDYYASIEPAEALPEAVPEPVVDGEDSAEEDSTPSTVTPRRLASAPASPAILPSLFDDERPSDHKIVEAIRKNAPILA